MSDPREDVKTLTGDVDVAALLSRAASLQFASLALQAPSRDVLADMRDLLPSLPDDQQQVATAILTTAIEDWEPEFFSVLGPAGLASVESSYERASQASRGPLLMEVAGYYRAFGYAPVRLKEVPDHVAVEFGFLSFLAMKQAFAAFESRSDDRAITSEAFIAFHHRHVGMWLPDFLDALRASGSSLYTRIADFASVALSESSGDLPS